MRNLALLLVFSALAAPALCAEERMVYETNSLYHHIVVSETDAVRILRFHKGPAREALGDSYAQSVISRDDPNALHMRYATYAVTGAALVENPRRALFIGLGAGSMPKFFARAFPDCTVEVAEIDAKVAEVARRYFFLPDLPNMTVTIMDGRMYLRQSKEKYDLIYLDAYRDQMIPFHLMTRDFLEEVKQKLAPGGVLVSNIAVRDSAQLYPWMLRTYQSCFPTILSARIPLSINKVLLCLAEEDAVKPADLVANARDFAQRVPLGYDPVECARGYDDSSSSTRSDKVLTDQFAPVNLMWRKEADAKDWEY
jgi:spermidine synthase